MVLVVSCYFSVHFPRPLPFLCELFFLPVSLPISFLFSLFTGRSNPGKSYDISIFQTFGSEWFPLFKGIHFSIVLHYYVLFLSKEKRLELMYSKYYFSGMSLSLTQVFRQRDEISKRNFRRRLAGVLGDFHVSYSLLLSSFI